MKRRGVSLLCKKRIGAMLLLSGILLLGLIGRLYYWQIYKNETIGAVAQEQRLKERLITAHRGAINDRHGRQLAITIEAASIYAVPHQIKDAENTAAQLSAILAVPAGELAKLLQQNGDFIWIKRLVDKHAGQQVKELNLKGIYILTESKRRYPNETLAAHVLGFTGIDNQGLDGIEITLEKQLKGVPGRVVFEEDGIGKQIPITTAKVVPSSQGNDVFLTIDSTIQFIVENELEQAMMKTSAKGGTIIAMNPKTGEILAMANRPTFNPNSFGSFSPEVWKNQAVSNIYEPGSTFKTITASAALQEKVVHLTDMFKDPGYVDVADRRIHNWEVKDSGMISFVDVVKNSSNVGFVEVGRRLGGAKFHQYIKSFGFGKPTGIELPGEEYGIIFDRDDLVSINLATSSIGQGLAVTPIQLITSIATVANNGVLLRPQIIREIRTKQGDLVKGFKPETVRQVIDPQTAHQVRSVLEKVVSEGGGQAAFIPGFRIGGKTGTAQKIKATGGYEAGKYVASFVCIAPVDDPQIVLLVVLDEPQGAYYGGQVAAPIGKAVLQRVFQYLKTSPEATGTSGGNIALETYIVPDIVGKTLKDAKASFAGSKLAMQVVGQGSTVILQTPSPGGKHPPGTVVTLYTNAAANGTDTRLVTTPNCLGKTMRRASEMLGDLGLQLNPQGSGIAVRQSPAPYTQLPPGSEITVFFEP